MRTAAWLAAILAIAGCNTYELYKVTPTTTKIGNSPPTPNFTAHPPDLVFVVDRSGSMADSDTGSASRVCPVAGQQNASCKWDELLSVMTGDANPGGGVLQQIEAQGSLPNDPLRMGLVTFSGSTDPASGSVDDACKPGVLAVPVAADTQSAMASALEAIAPAGATPTASSLQIAAAAFPATPSGAVSRDRIVVLLTDGAPNCNASASIAPSTCGGDRCTFSCDATTGLATDARGCLDEDGLVAAVTALHAEGIKTMVIGFGADANTGAAYATLDAAARAGGFPRTDTGGNVVTPAFFPATDQASLEAALQKVPGVQSCIYSLDTPPVSKSAVEVEVQFCGQPAQTLADTEWQLDLQTSQITLTDQALCTRLHQGTPECPNNIWFKYISQ